VTSAENGRWARSAPRRVLRSRASRGLRTFWMWEPSIGDLHRPRWEGSIRESPKCVTGWQHRRAWEQRSLGRLVLSNLPRLAASWGKRTKRSRWWRKLSQRRKEARNACRRRRYAASRENCFSSPRVLPKPSLVSPRHRHRPSPEREVAGTSRRNEP